MPPAVSLSPNYLRYAKARTMEPSALQGMGDDDAEVVYLNSPKCQ